MLVSIIIPIYNVEPYIRQCLQSVMDQTLTEGLECILVDDCGQDKSMDIAQQMVDEYDGSIDFRIIHHDKNRGLSAARNTGIRSAKGEWLYFLDSDDWIIPECIELMTKQVDMHPDVDMVFAGADVNEDAYWWFDYTQKKLPDYSNDRDWLQLSMLKRFAFGMTAWNRLISRRFIMDSNVFFQEGIIHEDEIWNFKIAKYISAASFVRHNTYFYNVNFSGISKVKVNETDWQIFVRMWNYILKDIDGYNKCLQARGLCTFIFEYYRGKYPKCMNKDIATLLFRAGIKMSFPFNLYTIVQSALALLNSNKYFNYKLRKRIVIDTTFL